MRNLLLIDIIKGAIISNTNVSKAKISLPIPVNTPAVNKCVLGDIVNKPEEFKLEAYIDGNEVVMRIKPKKGGVIDVETNDT